MSKEAKKEPEEKEEGPRSFSVFVGNLAEGEAERELSYHLHEVCKRLQEEAHLRQAVVKGGLVLKIKIAADKNGTAAIHYDVEPKMPKRQTSNSVYWMTKGGNLTPDNPKQQSFKLKEVPAAKGEAREVAVPAAKEIG
jgi:hypothetical protein